MNCQRSAECLCPWQLPFEEKRKDKIQGEKKENKQNRKRIKEFGIEEN